MWDWFVSLTNIEKIAAAGVVSGFVVGVAGILFARHGGKEKNPGGNTVTGPVTASNGSTVIQPVINGDPEQAKKLDKILALLEKDHPADAPRTTSETQSLREPIASLLQSQDKLKQEIVALLQKGKLDEAINKLKALDQEQSQHAQQQVDKAVETKLELAALLTYRDPDESERLLAEAVALAPDNPRANRQHGWLLLRLGRIDDAIAAFKRIEVWAQAQGDSELKGTALGNLGLAYADLGQVKKAIEHYQQALVISREIKDRQGEGADLGNLGSAYYRLGQVEKARDYYSQALKIFEDIKSPNAETVRGWLTDLDQPSADQ